MKKSFKVISVFFLIFSFSAGATCFPAATAATHIEKLFDLRSSITNQGKSLPADIKQQTSVEDIRTLERIFELNTSTLTTIEAYFRLFKMMMTTNTETKLEVVDLLNEWLRFIGNQSKYDIEYLEQALTETKTEAVKKQITTARDNIQQLIALAQQGMNENRDMTGAR
jgi:hypothetical protein